jgi:ferredoxin
MGLNPKYVRHLRLAMQESSIRTEDVKVVGTPIEEVKTKFNIPHESWTYRFAQRSAHILDRQVYQQFRPGNSIYPMLSGLFGAHPKIDAAKCTLCGICEKSCPVNAIDLSKKKILASKCIDCLVCSELCPFQAIQIKSISERKNA